MSVTSFAFFLFLAAGLLVYHHAPGPRARSLVVAALNIVFLATYLDGPLHAAPLLLAIAWGYVAVRLAASRRALAVLLAITVLGFVYLKQYFALAEAAPLPFAYTVIGLSYILFRVVHLIVDSNSGDLERPPGPLSYLAYVIFFPCFLSGPIQRYQDFAAQAVAPSDVTPPDAYAALGRILTGLIKVLLVSSALEGIFQTLSARLLGEGAAVLVAAGATATFALYLYANFGGYTDIVIGMGRLFGFRLPENFDRPFAAASFIEFWSRWHMSLSTWFKTYLFNPLLKALVARVPAPGAAPFLAVAAFFVTFLVMGLWHGTTRAFLYYGLVLAVGISVNKLFQVWVGAWLGRRRYRALAEHPAYRLCGRGLTFAYFALSLSAFWLDAAALERLAVAFGIDGLVRVFLVTAAAAALVMAAFEIAGRAAARLAPPIERLVAAPAAGSAWLGAKLFALVTLATLFNSAPDFVYQAY